MKTADVIKSSPVCLNHEGVNEKNSCQGHIAESLNSYMTMEVPPEEIYMY